MKHLLLIGLYVFLSACQQTQTSGEKNIVVANDTVSKIDISVHRADTILTVTDTTQKKSVLLMKLRGAEPGWYGEVYTDHLRLLVDYGKDSLTVLHNFENSLSQNGFVASLCIAQTLKTKQKDVSLTLDIIDKACMESGSGDKRNRTVSMLYNHKVYKGCGEIMGH
ncbi:MAG: hypothetical protein QM534_10965 [Sediminibacterium sp.]|nr:hypothetical protein [Sediminibacterium sp.]